MTTTTASAPGKLVLCGEYAVLDGAPAICMAVNRRATVRVSGGDSDWHRVIAPGYSDAEGRFIVTDTAIEWLQAADEYAIVDAVWCSLSPTPTDTLCIELDSNAFVDSASNAKIGIGSSAALTVALVAALSRSTDVTETSTRAHRLFQNGKGSGADVATSVNGGLIEFRRGRAKTVSLTWPDGLAYRLIWTGVPASTSDKLDRLAAKGQRTSRGRLSTAAARMAEAWRSTDSVLQEYPAYIDALRQFSIDHELGIFDAGHDQLAIEAHDVGLIYKPCGAGGGDVGILLGRDDRQLDDFAARHSVPGCHVLDCALDLNGAELELS